MATAGKWAVSLSGEVPFSAAGRYVLMHRLAIVSHYFPLAARRADEDVEYVHQLRVSTRRGTAALSLFEEVLSPKRTRAVRRVLRDIRRSAGAARELDVFLLRLSAYEQHLSPAELVAVRRFLQRLRQHVQQPLLVLFDRCGQGQLQQQCEQLLCRLRWRGTGDEPRWSSAAVAYLRPLVEQTIVRPGELHSIDDLHRFRISCKRLRYALELTVDVMHTDLNRILSRELKELQSRLGSINDHAFIIARVRDRLDHAKGKHRRALQRIVDFERAELAAAEEAFRGWWTDQRAEEFRRDWRHPGYQPPASDAAPGRAPA